MLAHASTQACTPAHADTAMPAPRHALWGTLAGAREALLVRVYYELLLLVLEPRDTHTHTSARPLVSGMVSGLGFRASGVGFGV